MLIHSNAGVMLVGFMISLWLVPRVGTPDYLQKFFGYACAVILLLTATSEVMILYPIPFYFMLGSGITLLSSIFTLVKRISIQKD